MNQSFHKKIETFGLSRRQKVNCRCCVKFHRLINSAIDPLTFEERDDPTLHESQQLGISHFDFAELYGQLSNLPDELTAVMRWYHALENPFLKTFAESGGVESSSRFAEFAETFIDEAANDMHSSNDLQFEKFATEFTEEESVSEQ